MKRYFLLLVFISFVIFSSLLFTSFAFDDFPQIVNASRIHTLQNIPFYFAASLQYPGQANAFVGFFYRPIVYALFAVLYVLGNGKPLLFHFFQLVFYTVNTLLLFSFFTSFFKKRVAFLLALIFLIHPVNETIAAYIADIPQCLFFFFGMLALLVAKKKSFSRTIPVITVATLLLLSLLSKETGILFFIIILFYIGAFHKEKFKRYALALLTSFSMYGILRVIASKQYFLRVSNSAIIHSSFFDRLRLIPEIIYFYLRELFLPRTFTLSSVEIQHVSTLEIGIQIGAILAFCVLLAVFGVFLWKKRRKEFMYYVFFLLWFVIGIIFHVQIFTLEVLAAKRFLYFPLVGLLGLLGIVLNSGFLKEKKWKIIYALCIISLVLLYALTTMRMNTYWFSVHI